MTTARGVPAVRAPTLLFGEAHPHRTTLPHPKCGSADVERYKRLRTATPTRDGQSRQVSTNRELMLLSSVVRRCMDWQLTTRTDNPVSKVKRFKELQHRERVLTFDEEARLLAQLPEPDATAVRLALQCGARIASQILPLTWGDLDLERGRLRLSAKDAKNHRELWVPVADALVARLRTMQATSTSPLLFPAPLGGVLHHFQDHFRQAVKAAGLDSAVTPHCLRHSWATRFMESSGDALLLQRAGGWSSLKMVERYAHVREGRDAEVMRQMEAARATWARQQQVPTKTPRPMRRAPRNA